MIRLHSRDRSRCCGGEDHPPHQCRQRPVAQSAQRSAARRQAEPERGDVGARQRQRDDARQHQPRAAVAGQQGQRDRAEEQWFGQHGIDTVCVDQGGDGLVLRLGGAEEHVVQVEAHRREAPFPGPFRMRVGPGVVEVHRPRQWREVGPGGPDPVGETSARQQHHAVSGRDQAAGDRQQGSDVTFRGRRADEYCGHVRLPPPPRASRHP
ncbi:hypothetical protein [Streptomyces sp. NPDC014734]|uniref:hypothetical protein n=1 Tax=Streptomyces sp. NPDC014734 TaxID=3364886 RepID=UPI0036FC6DAE